MVDKYFYRFYVFWPAVPIEARRGCWVPLELKLEMILNHHVNAGNLTWVLWNKTVLVTTEPCFFSSLLSHLFLLGILTQLLQLGIGKISQIWWHKRQNLYMI